MIIKVFSRQEIIKEITHNKLEKPTLIISIVDSCDNCPQELLFPYDNLIHTVSCKFDDIDRREPVSEGFRLMSEKDARKIAINIKNYMRRDAIQQIYVHCVAGVSRSAGVAAALMKYLNDDDMPIFTNSKYSPNMWCYRLTLNAMHQIFDEQKEG